MDNTFVSLCSGYDGIALGVSRVVRNLFPLAFCEREGFACANLVALMEAGKVGEAPIWTDVKTFPSGLFRGSVDFLFAGYPCQPFSTSGKRGGENDPRHLWPCVRSVVRDMRPACCLFENVAGHVTLGLPGVLSDLEEAGYEVEAGLYEACEAGDPHHRRRVFILAHDRSQEPHWLSDFIGEEVSPSDRLPSPPPHHHQGLQGRGVRSGYDGSSECPARPCGPFATWDGRVVCGNWESSQPALCGRNDVGTSRVDQLRLLGNGVDPRQCEIAFRSLCMKLFA